MLRCIKLLLFDFDGTLVDARELYKFTITNSLKQRGYKVNKKKFKENFGKKLNLFLKILKIKDIKEIRKEVNSYVLKNYKQVKAIPGVYNIFSLKQKKILISNSVSPFVKAISKNLHFKFDKIIGGEQFTSKEQELRRVIKEYKLKPNEAVYIGDRAEDNDYARKAKCHSILVSNKYSWNSRKRLLASYPDYIIKNLNELRKILD